MIKYFYYHGLDSILSWRTVQVLQMQSHKQPKTAPYVPLENLQSRTLKLIIQMHKNLFFKFYFFNKFDLTFI